MENRLLPERKSPALRVAHPRTAPTAMRLGRGVYAASSSFTCRIGVRQEYSCVEAAPLCGVALRGQCQLDYAPLRRFVSTTNENCGKFSRPGPMECGLTTPARAGRQQR